MKRKAVFICLMVLFFLWGCQENTPVRPVLKLDGVAFLKIEEDSLLMDVEDLSVEELVGQLLIHQQTGAPTPEIIELTRLGLIGGIQFSDLKPSEFIHWRDELQKISPLPLFIGLDGNGIYHNTFKGTDEIPEWVSWQASGTDSLIRFGQEMTYNRLEVLRPNWAELPHCGDQSSELDYALLSLSSFCSQRGILPIVYGGSQSDYIFAGSSDQQLQSVAYYKQLISAGMAGIRVEVDAQSSSSVLAVTSFVRNKLGYGGLIFADLQASTSPEEALLMNPDLFITQASPEHTLEQVLELLSTGVLDEKWLRTKVVRILKAKTWITNNQPVEEKKEIKKAKTLQASLIGSSPPKPITTSVDDYFYNESWSYWNRVVQESSLVIAANPEEQLPYKNQIASSFRIIHHGTLSHQPFDNYFGKYSAYESWTAKDWKAVQRLMDNKGEKLASVLVLHDVVLDSAQLAHINSWGYQGTFTLVNLKSAANLRALNPHFAIVQAFTSDESTQELIPQLLFGGIPAKGKLPYTISELYTRDHGYKTEKTRLSYGIAQQENVSPHALVGIDAIVHTAIEDEAFPGAQVMVIKNGNAIYNKSFGYHTYARKRSVNHNDLYDVASITKVAATGLVAMKAYEEKQYSLNGRLKNYLQESSKTRLRNLTPKQLLSHRTGLQPHLPVVPYLLSRDTNNANCNLFFCKSISDDFPVQVADSFYFAKSYYDKVWRDLYRLRPRRTKFRYSDANFVLLQRLLEEQGGHSLDTLVDRDFYRSLGLRFTGYNPLNKHSRDRIIPTQNDDRWRYQLLQGHVHDETAALMGGVAGHAGLFSNANNLAVIFEMLLNKGTYGGQEFLKASTVETFTKNNSDNHRGLAFDKPKREQIKEGDFPKQVSTALFGHKGFTGGCIWADPEQDLVFIFLSNRVYPDPKNNLLFRKRVRERVHQVIYDALNTFKYDLPRMNLAAS